jgi:hypothetical protein
MIKIIERMTKKKEKQDLTMTLKTFFKTVFEKLKTIPKNYYVYTALIGIIILLSIQCFINISNKGGSNGSEQYHQYTSYEIYQESNQLRYDSLKLALANEVDRYIQKVSNRGSALSGLVLIDECLHYDIDLCFVLAQGEQESHFGTQGLARKTNSVFNVYAYDGQSYNAINAGGKYKHPNNCVAPYLSLLKRDYLVKGKTENDLLNRFVNARWQRYASAPNYEQALVNKITNIRNTTDIDSLYQALRKQRLIIGN